MGACTEPGNLLIVTELMPRGSVYDLLHDSSGMDDNSSVIIPSISEFRSQDEDGERGSSGNELVHKCMF